MGAYIILGGFIMAKKNENALTIKENLLQGSKYVIHWKWGVSSGYATKGWTVCNCYIGAYRVGSTKGGGYDMKGETLDQFINAAFNDELQALDHETYTGLCKSSYTGNKYADGGTGYDPMIRLLEALGFVVEYYYMGNNDTIYTIKKA